LLALTHLAEVDVGGTFIEFGRPARMKYTGGTWRNDWGADDSDDAGAFTHLASIGSIYFHVDAPEALTARLRLRKVGTEQVVVYINGETLLTLDLTGSGVESFEIPIPAANLRRGENALRLRATSTRNVDGQDISVAVYDLHLARDGAPEGPPLPAEWVVAHELGGAQRQALVTPAGGKIAFYVQVPDAGKLSFAMGASADGATATVGITPAVGERAEILAAEVATSWRDHLLDLTAYAGQVVRIELESEGPDSATVAWAGPQLVVPMPEQERVPGEARNVVVLTIDTLRASKLRAYNPRSRVETPALDAFAEDATVFENAQSPENWTKPSVASILTSLTPMTHGTKEDGASLPQEALMVSEVYQAAGFETATFLANGYVSDRFGFAQGWDHYTNYIRENKNTGADNVFREAATWIEAHKDERFFVYIQTIDPHVPYDPPGEILALYDENHAAYTGQVRNRSTGNQLGDAKRNPPRIIFTEADRQRLKDLHDAEITFHDRYFGPFIDKLKELGLYEDMVFVITSDHGEEFNEHGSWGHGHSVYQELLHVPLIVRWPAAESAGERVPHVVSTMDIGPTILEASGVAIPEVFEGGSLLGHLRGAPPARPALAFSDFLEDRRVVRAGRWKLILRGNLRWSMFDLEADPNEQNELELGDQSRIALRYLRIMLGQFLGAADRGDWLSGAGGGVSRVLPQADSQIDAELCRQLELIGYVDARCENM
jgi:arylsulfatase A-like enzyme